LDRNCKSNRKFEVFKRQCLKHPSGTDTFTDGDFLYHFIQDKINVYDVTSDLVATLTPTRWDIYTLNNATIGRLFNKAGYVCPYFSRRQNFNLENFATINRYYLRLGHYFNEHLEYIPGPLRRVKSRCKGRKEFNKLKLKIRKQVKVFKNMGALNTRTWPYKSPSLDEYLEALGTDQFRHVASRGPQYDAELDRYLKTYMFKWIEKHYPEDIELVDQKTLQVIG